MLMREMNRRADFAEQLERSCRSQAVRVAKSIQPHALDIFHRQVGLPAAGDAAIQQARDIRMLEAGQNLPLLPKTFGHQTPRRPDWR